MRGNGSKASHGSYHIPPSYTPADMLKGKIQKADTQITHPKLFLFKNGLLLVMITQFQFT